MRRNLDYSKSIIYKIKNKNPNITDHYIGSTVDLVKRKARHKYNCTTPTASEHNYKLYQHIRQMGGWDCWDVVILEHYACENRKRLNAREKEHIQNNRSNLNVHYT